MEHLAEIITTLIITSTIVIMGVVGGLYMNKSSKKVATPTIEEETIDPYDPPLRGRIGGSNDQ